MIITLRHTRGRIVLKVSDNGSGLPKQANKSKGMGLRIMQSRAGMIGATLAIEPNSNGGVSVICAVPQNGSVSKTKAHARKN
jgi:signal transduction histidine kinase